MKRLPLQQHFPLQDPVPREDIVDRGSFLDELVTRLSAGERLLLAGPRRTGKTSLALEALRRLRERGYITAYIDLFGVESRSEFAELLIDAVFEDRSGMRRTLHAMRNLAAGVAGAARDVSVKFPGFEVAFSLARKSQDTLFEEALDLAQRVSLDDNRRSVIVLDEFQDFEKLGGDAVFKKLRSHFQRHSNVSYLFLGSKAGAMRELFGKGRQAFYRFAVPLDIPPIPTEAWIAYLQRKFRDRGLEPTGLALHSIVTRTGGHPSDTMWVCQELLHVALQAGHSTVSVELADVGYEQALQHLRLAYDEIWEGMAERVGTQQVASRIARGLRPYAADEHSQAVTRALRGLVQSGVVEKRGRGDYMFTETMFAEYIRRRTGR